MLKKIIIGFIAFILALMLGVVLFAKDVDVRVSESEAQSAIEAYLTTHSHDLGRVKVKPNSLSVDFKANDRAEVFVDVDLNGLGYSGQFSGRFSSGINYRNPRLYLKGIELLDGGFSTDEATQSELSDLKKVTTDILRRQRAERVSEETGKPVDNSLAKNTQIVENFTRNATQTFFEAVPIYNISGDSLISKLASLALKDVRFTETEAIVTLSPVTALLRVLGMILTGLFILLWLFSGFLTQLMAEYFFRKVKSDD